MKLQFWGAAQTVTGSMHLVKVNGYNILLDCGLYQGRRKEAFERNKNFEFEPAEIDAVILSHAHIDHTGNLPTRMDEPARRAGTEDRARSGAKRPSKSRL